MARNEALLEVEMMRKNYRRSARILIDRMNHFESMDVYHLIQITFQTQLSDDEIQMAFNHFKRMLYYRFEKETGRKLEYVGLRYNQSLTLCTNATEVIDPLQIERMFRRSILKHYDPQALLTITPYPEKETLRDVLVKPLTQQLDLVRQTPGKSAQDVADRVEQFKRVAETERFHVYTSNVRRNAKGSGR